MIQSSQPIEAKSIYRESRQHSLEPGPQFKLLLWRLIVRCGKVSITIKGFRSLCVEMGRLAELHVSQATWIVCDKSWWSTQFFTGHAISAQGNKNNLLSTCFRTCYSWILPIFSHASSVWSISRIAIGLAFVKFKLDPQWPISDKRNVCFRP